MHAVQNNTLKRTDEMAPRGLDFSGVCNLPDAHAGKTALLQVV